MRSAAAGLLVAVFCVWLVVLVINLFGLVALLLHVSYWTDGSHHHDPMFTVLPAIAVLGCVPIAVLALIGAFYRDGRGRALVVVAVTVTVAAMSAVPYFIHVAEVQITSGGFAQARYATDEAFDLVLANRTAAPARVCAGRNGDCDGSEPAALASGGVVVAPGGSRRIDIPSGTHRLTLADAEPGVVRRDTTVKVNPGPSN